LGPALPSPRQRGEKVILIADARDHLIEAMVAEYGRDNVAIFMCPNTNELSSDRDRACHSVARIYTPSRWCADTILQTVWAPGTIGQVTVMPLGVDEPFATRWTQHRIPYGREDMRVHMLHVTTDTFWDGRKGTEELLHAWSLARKQLGAQRHATLTIHCLPQLYATIHQELGDLGLVDDVKLLRAPLRGSTPEELFDLIAAHDILVAPSRSEGFGIMPLSALVSGTPVLTTAGTGQDQYLAEKKDGVPVLGGWMQIATMGSGELQGEDGEAPMVRSDQLAFTLSAVWSWSMYELELLRSVQRNKEVQADWSWKTRRAAWAESLIEWEKRA
jgi:glycosyltransferase involved in cell wall biosynthesis